MSFNLYDETANSLFKRLTNKTASFPWGMLSKDGAKIPVTFSFDEVVCLVAHARDMQELRLDLLLSFAQNVKVCVFVCVLYVSCVSLLPHTNPPPIYIRPPLHWSST